MPNYENTLSKINRNRDKCATAKFTRYYNISQIPIKNTCLSVKI